MSEIKVGANIQAAKAYGKQGLHSLNTSLKQNIQVRKIGEPADVHVAGEGNEPEETIPNAATVQISLLGSGEAAKLSADRPMDTIRSQNNQADSNSGRVASSPSASGTGSAESNVRHEDIVKEMVIFKAKAHTQVTQLMQAQANSKPQGVINLLR